MKGITLLMLFLSLQISSDAEASIGLPPKLVDAIITVESSNRPHVVSRVGCRGLGQISEPTWYWITEMMGKDWHFDDAFDPEKNRMVTEYYLYWLTDYLLKKGQYSLDLLFASYNAGPGAVRRAKWNVPNYPETKRYVEKVKLELGVA